MRRPGAAHLLDEAFVRLKGMPRTARWLAAPAPDLAPRPVPRILWSLWLQGEERAPPLVRHCLDSLRRHNPGWEVRVLSEATLPEAIPLDGLPPGLPPPARSDVIRLRLLARHGGVWADATVLMTRPLDHWLPPLMQAGFFAFQRPGPDRMLASWFLASAAGGDLATRMDGAVRAYWAGRAARGRTGLPHYYWLHYLLEGRHRTRPAFRTAWDRIPHLSADGPHLLQRHLAGRLPAEAMGNLGAMPLHKLTTKAGFGLPEVKAALRTFDLAP